MRRGPSARAHLAERLVAGDAGVVHDDVDPAVRLPGCAGDRFRRVCGAATSIEQHRTAELRATWLSGPSCRRTIEADHVRALVGEPARGRLADAARGAGDQRDLALEGVRESRRPVGPSRLRHAQRLAGHERRLGRQHEAQHAARAALRRRARP